MPTERRPIDSMGRSSTSLFVASLLGFVVSSVLLVVVVGFAALVVFSGVQEGVPVAETLIDLAVPYLPIVTALVVTATLTAIGSAWAVARRASIPKSERLQSTLEEIERRNAAAESLGLSAVVAPPEPTAEDALEDLKRRYVAGEIDETAFERKVDRLVANDSVEESRAAREREATLER